MARGAKPGNKNALKHGLYAKRIRTEEKNRIAKLPVKDIEGEIAYLRTVISRLAHILEKNGIAYEETQLPSDSVLKTLYSLNEAMRTLLTYVRTHALLVGELAEWEKEIEEGKALARLDLNVYDYFTYTPGTDE